MAELAKEAGISTRTLRFYRERKLLPSPRREGRVAWYSDAHLARLRTIATLLDRGHTLGGIAELIAAWENGRDVGELLGLEKAIAAPWSEETPVRLTPEALADSFGADVTPENLAAQPWRSATSPSRATTWSTSAAACWTRPPRWSARACRCRRCWPPGARCAGTWTRWPTCSPC